MNARGYVEGSVWSESGSRHVLQHRYVMERHLGRALLASEDVHHLNEITNDNRIENLEVIMHGEHATLHGVKRTGPHNISDEQRTALSERTRRMNIARGKGYRLNLTPEERSRRAAQLAKNDPKRKAIT